MMRTFPNRIFPQPEIIFQFLTVNDPDIGQHLFPEKLGEADNRLEFPEKKGILIVLYKFKGRINT